MVTTQESKVVKYNSDTGERIVNATLFGLSTDEKPTENIGNGSAFVEMDTGAVYFFDEENGEWKEFGGNV